MLDVPIDTRDLRTVDAKRMRLVERAATTTDCNLRRADGLTMVRAPSPSDTYALGRTLISESSALGALRRAAAHHAGAAAALAEQIDQR